MTDLVSYEMRQQICHNIDKHFGVKIDPDDKSLGKKIHEIRHSKEMQLKVSEKIRDTYYKRDLSVISVGKMAKLLNTYYNCIARLEKNDKLITSVCEETRIKIVAKLKEIFNVDLDYEDPLLGLEIFEQIQTSRTVYDVYRKNNGYKYTTSNQRDRKTRKLIYFSQNTLGRLTGVYGTMYSILRVEAENHIKNRFS